MSLKPYLTIPGTSAYHVVGNTAVDLAHGDLTVVIPSMTNPIASGKTPVLLLAVGQAAFQLYSSTVFGTLAGDDRVYLFRPDLGEGVVGYVKIVLPDGVREHGSEFNALQERFEKTLISRGLLKEGDGPAEKSVTVPSVTVAHVVGETTVELARGELILSTTSPATESHVADPKAILILSVGKATFPLHLSTVFGTLADDDHTYVFKPEIQDADVPQGGYVKLTLPETSDRSTKSAQDKFEELLIDYGLLKTGVEAAGDEVSRSISDHASSAAESIRKSTAEFLAANPPTTSPMSFSDTTHSVASQGLGATSTLNNATHYISTSVSDAASSAGAFVSSRATGGPPSPSTTAAAASVTDVWGSVGKGTATVTGAVSDSFGDIVQNQFGTEARDIGGKVADSVGNVSGAVAHIAGVGTGAMLATGGVKGAVGLANADDSMEGEDGFVNGGAEEMETFTIEEKDEGRSGEWKNVQI